jgi:hypothetical protein
MEREEPNASFVGLDVHPVDFLVARDDLVGEFAVAVNQRVDRLGDLALDQPAHFEKGCAQAAQLFLIAEIGMQVRLIHGIASRSAHPKRPVI